MNRVKKYSARSRCCCILIRRLLSRRMKFRIVNAIVGWRKRHKPDVPFYTCRWGIHRFIIVSAKLAMLSWSWNDFYEVGDGWVKDFLWPLKVCILIHDSRLMSSLSNDHNKAFKDIGDYGECSSLFLVCRLPHCEVQDREFETVAAWRKHVALARSHLEDGKRLSFATYIVTAFFGYLFYFLWEMIYEISVLSVMLLVHSSCG